MAAGGNISARLRIYTFDTNALVLFLGNLVEMEKSLLGVSSDSHARGCIKCITPRPHFVPQVIIEKALAKINTLKAFFPRLGITGAADLMHALGGPSNNPST